MKEGGIKDCYKLYQKGLCNKCKSTKPGNDIIATTYLERKQGRLSLVGENLEIHFKSYTTVIRYRGTSVESNVVVGVPLGVLLKHNTSVLERVWRDDTTTYLNDA